MNKFVFVSGGVCSSLGKGIAASSIGALLEGSGLNIRMVKCDPYINVDAGTMSPIQHGEAYVTDDGMETDLDLGNYARFTSGNLTKANSMTAGQVYKTVIEKERAGCYEGRCVQVIPHITDEIKSRIMAAAGEYPQTDVVIVEIGGTVGDIESIPFLEAARQIINESGRENAISVHLTLITEVSDELKTKPTQHSVKAMQEMGIQPDLLICRSPVMLDEATRRKIALYTNVDPEAVFTSRNVDKTIYEIPLIFHEQKLDQVLQKKLGIQCRQPDVSPWKWVMERIASLCEKVRIGIVGKHMDLHDSYKSVYESLFHAGLECGVAVELVKIDSSRIEEADSAGSVLGAAIDGILIPGGFGQRGVNGMVTAAAFAREKKIPFFGICLGMQVMVIDWARSILGWADADSSEFNPDAKHAVISLPEGQVDAKNCGGAIRLGKGESIAEGGTHILAAYGAKHIWERHRNSYEFSNQYRADMSASGLKIAALAADSSLVDCIEWPDHPWGVGVQFHPEYKSKPTHAAPLFRDFICAAKKNNKQ